MVGYRPDPAAQLEVRRSQHQRQVCQKNSYGRQLARVHAPQYHETLFSRIYPGKQDSGSTYIPILQALDNYLAFPPAQKARTILRSDAGFGGDANVNRALAAHWQVLGKGKGGPRPKAYAQRVPTHAWQAVGAKRWVARAVDPVCYLRPTQHLVLCWVTQAGRMKYSTLVCSIPEWSLTETVAAYDDRGQCETEIQADKGGLHMERRRKKRLAAQETLILLTDLAHNLLAWSARWMFPDNSPLARFGTTRLIEDVFALPGRLLFQEDKLMEVHLNQSHPYASQVASGLERLLVHFGHP